MSGTQNPTLPNEWQSNIEYSKGQTVITRNIIYKSLANNNENHDPPFSPDYWVALDIYKKDLTVMEHGDYSGDDSFWERDQLYIDSDGWVYANNENTGINVNGRIEYNFTNAQLDAIAARVAQLVPMGPQGLRGLQGIKGEKGDPGSVILTPEQKEELKGDQGQQGDSNYDIWKRNGHPEGTEQDYLTWLQNNIVILDTELNVNSHNGVENQAIASAFASYQRRVNELLHQFDARLTSLEDRLKYLYQGQYHTFSFGITENGQYGYRIDNSDSITPFNLNNEVQSTAGVENITGIMYSSIAEMGELVNQTLIDNDEVQSASLVGTTSIPSQRLSNHSFSDVNTDVTTLSFDIGMGTTHTIYENNEFVDTTYNYILQGMTFDSNGLITNGRVICEGIKFPSYSLDNRGYYFYIEIEPYYEGGLVNYSIGIFNASQDNTPLFNLVTDDELTTYKENGSFNSPTTLIIPNIKNNQGVFIATRDGGYKFKITKIYIS